MSSFTPRGLKFSLKSGPRQPGRGLLGLVEDCDPGRVKLDCFFGLNFFGADILGELLSDSCEFVRGFSGSKSSSLSVSKAIMRDGLVEFLGGRFTRFFAGEPPIELSLLWKFN